MISYSLRSLILTRSWLSVLTAGVLLAVTGQAHLRTTLPPPVATSSFTQDPLSIAETLEPGKPLVRQVTGGAFHLFRVRMSAEQYLRLNVEQQGIDLTITTFAPNGQVILRSDLAEGERGTETLSLIAKNAGVHQIEVRSNRSKDPPASYEIRIERLQAASNQDRAAAGAQTLIAEARTLFDRRTDESLAGAITKYREAIPLLEAANDPLMKVRVLNRVGRCLVALGVYRQAADSHLQALPLVRAIGDRYEEGVTLTQLGNAYRLTHENERALDYLNQSIEIWQLVKDRRGELEALNHIARVYYGVGEVYKALLCLDHALELARSVSDQSGEMTTVSGMALAYYLLGEHEKASEHWKQALAIAKAERLRGMEIVFLGKLGAVHDALGQKQEAIAYLDQAIALAREQGSLLEEAAALQSKGRVYRSIGEPRKAIELLDQSLVLLKSAKDSAGVARAHYNLGKCYTDLGEYEQAIDYLNRALVVWRANGDAINLAATIRELARAERGRGNLPAALALSEAALNIIEWVRSRAGEPELRASYLAIVQDCFELRIDVLMQMHKLDSSQQYAATALQASESMRARSLLDTLAEAGVDVRRGVPAELLARERAITQELSAKASEQARLRGANADAAALAQLDKEVKQLAAQHERIEAQIRGASPDYAALTQVLPLSLADLRAQVIDGQTLLLEYSLGSERSYVWAVTSSSIETYELPKREVIDAAARRVHELMTARNRRLKFEEPEERRKRIAAADAAYPEAARALSKIVLGPVAGQMANKKLLIVSDGALQYVPFAALPIPATNGSTVEPLMKNHEVVSLPSASTLAVLRRQFGTRTPAPRIIAVLADPVFSRDDERVKDSLARTRTASPDTKIVNARLTNAISKRELTNSATESGWEGGAANMTRLPFTRREAEAITALVPMADRKQELDFAANRSNATSADLSNYRIVHFATHGFLNSRHPQLSGLVLSLVDEQGREQDGFLRAHEIYQLRMPADLVVLSGCRTGLGKEIKGEGLVGLTRAFMHAGAERVMVSLWDVHDEATAELMTRFYGRLLGPEKVSPAAALRAAQLSMAQDKRWAAPYFWAGFTLQGEPR